MYIHCTVLFVLVAPPYFSCSYPSFFKCRSVCLADKVHQGAPVIPVAIRNQLHGLLENPQLYFCYFGDFPLPTQEIRMCLDR